MKRAQAMPYISFGVDDAAHAHDGNIALATAPRATLVGWQCGFEPLFIAVWSYLPGCTVDASDAIELATELLIEREWFADGPTEPDYVLLVGAP